MSPACGVFWKMPPTREYVGRFVDNFYNRLTGKPEYYQTHVDSKYSGRHSEGYR